jgi:hypothetical protein
VPELGEPAEAGLAAKPPAATFSRQGRVAAAIMEA